MKINKNQTWTFAVALIAALGCNPSHGSDFAVPSATAPSTLDGAADALLAGYVTGDVAVLPALPVPAGSAAPEPTIEQQAAAAFLSVEELHAGPPPEPLRDRNPCSKLALQDWRRAFHAATAAEASRFSQPMPDPWDRVWDYGLAALQRWKAPEGARGFVLLKDGSVRDIGSEPCDLARAYVSHPGRMGVYRPETLLRLQVRTTCGDDDMSFTLNMSVPLSVSTRTLEQAARLKGDQAVDLFTLVPLSDAERTREGYRHDLQGHLEGLWRRAVADWLPASCKEAGGRTKLVSQNRAIRRTAVQHLLQNLWWSRSPILRNHGVVQAAPVRLHDLTFGDPDNTRGESYWVVNVSDISLVALTPPVVQPQQTVAVEPQQAPVPGPAAAAAADVAEVEVAEVEVAEVEVAAVEVAAAAEAKAEAVPPSSPAQPQPEPVARPGLKVKVTPGAWGLRPPQPRTLARR